MRAVVGIRSLPDRLSRASRIAVAHAELSLFFLGVRQEESHVLLPAQRPDILLATPIARSFLLHGYGLLAPSGGI